MNSRNNGFTVIEVLLTVFLVALIGFAVWAFWTTEQEPVEEPTSEPVTIENAEDLDRAEDELMAEDLDGELDSSDLDEVLDE